MSSSEQVGVIPRSVASSIGLLAHGYTPLAASDRLDAVESHIRFMARAAAETDPRFKQIIPYGLVRQNDQALLMERLSGSGEARLHGKVSLGVGGHINPVDQRVPEDGPNHTEQGLIRATMMRELSEELFIEGVEAVTPYGTINDDSTAVGRVHLGVVFVVTVAPDGFARIREEETLRGEFLAWPAITARGPRMETWSSYLLQAQRQGLLR